MSELKHVILQDNLRVVLVRARNPNNIGAAARAMHNFGFKRLSVVTEYEIPLETARSAVDAGSVIAAAESFTALAPAIAECTYVIGTTAVGERDLEQPVLELKDAAEKIRAEIARGGRVAVLFGSEKTGLSNEELSHCHHILTVPMHQPEGERHLSMNLGQAVAVCLYEISRGEISLQADDSVTVSATAEEVEALSMRLQEVLVASEYVRHHPANTDAASLRRLVNRMSLNKIDATIWLGVLKQILWKFRKNGE